MENIIQVATTVDSKEIAEKMGRELVEKRLAACAQVMGPLESIYRWRGKVEETQEWLLLLKSREPLYSLMEEAIKKMHPYEVPEIVATVMETGSYAYFEWIREETK